MFKQIQAGFSLDINANDCSDLKLEQIDHPRIKEIVAQVLAENSGDIGSGSEFGEGGAG